MPNIESHTYLAEVFYKHNHVSQGWKYLKEVLAGHDSYPEASYSCIYNVVNGLMGVDADAPNNMFFTLPRLDMVDVTNVDVDHIPFAGRDIRVSHNGNNQTTLTLNSGASIQWKIRFQGNYDTISVGGVNYKSTVEYYNGKTISAYTVNVATGQTIVAKTIGNQGTDLPVLDPVELNVEAKGTQPAPGQYSLTDLNWVYGCGKEADKMVVNHEYNGSTITMGGQQFSHGLGCRDVSSVRYELNQHYTRLTVKVGYCDDSNVTGAVRFVVCGGVTEGKQLYVSDAITKSDGVQTINIDVTGLQYIVLGTIRDNYQQEVGFVSWADPILVANGTYIDTEAPSAPSNLTCTATTGRGATLQWDASTDNVAVTGYYIYKNGVLVGSTTNTNFVVSNLTPASTFNFEVKAFDAFANLSDASNTCQAKTQKPDPETYLSDILWDALNSNSYRLPSLDKSTDGNPIILAGTTYPKGLGVHAPSAITYNLGGVYYRFTSIVGLDNEVSANSGSTAATVAFIVYGDGEVLYDTGVMHGSDAPVSIDLNIKGVQTLQLVVTDGGDGINSDHGDWAMAKIYYSDDETGVGNVNNVQWFAASPSPFKNSTTINCRLNKADENAKILIYNESGSLVLATKFSSMDAAGNCQYKWNAENEQSGIYLVKIVGERIIKTFKIVKL